MKKLLDGLRSVLAVFTAVLFALIFCLVVAEVVCRNFLGFSMLWLTDLVQLIVCWMLAFGMSAIVYTEDHLRIDFIKNKFPEGLRRVVTMLTNALELAFFVMLVPYGILIVETKMKISFTTLRWPMGYQFAALPVFGALCAVFMLYHLVRSIRALRNRGDGLDG